MSIVLALILTAGTPEAAVPQVTELDPRSMSQREIRDHNANLERDNPDYIRCVRSTDTGSLIARNYSCRTNRQWVAAEEAANTEARVIGDAMRSKAVNSN